MRRRVEPQWIPRPHAGHFIVTWRCNLKCTGCPSWTYPSPDDLDASEWRAVFRQLRSLDVVKILGGEPFVRPDIVDLLRGVREIVDPYVLQVTTNGMLTRRTVDAVKAVGWPGLQLRISIDGTERTHDAMRGVSGSWKKVMRTAREVAELKADLGFRLGINFALTDESLDELDEMVALAEELGADLVPGVNLSPFLDGSIPPEERAQKVIMISDVRRALRALTDGRVGYGRQLPVVDRLISRISVARTFRQQLDGQQLRFSCRELRDLMYVLPNGDLVRCGLDHRPVGNLRRQRFDDIWFGEEIREHRARVDACPGCMQASIQILSRLYGGCLWA